MEWNRAERESLILAIDAGGTFFKSGLVTMDGHIIEKSRISCVVDSMGGKDAIHEVYRSLIRKQIKLAESRNAVIAAVGVDTPGPFDYEKGQSHMRHKFGSIYEVAIRPWIEELTGPLPIHFVHDSTAFLLGEYWRGALAGCDDCAGVMLGTGLGFAYMKNGEVCLNPRGGPGYSLYNTPFKNGTAEDYISRRGICRRYRRGMADDGLQPDVIDIARFAGEGDPVALKIFEETGDLLGEILRPVLQSISSRRLVVGGQISKAYSYFGTSLERSLDGIGLEMIVPSADPDDAHLLGCAYAILLQ